jgi:hypothetical protein
MAEADRLLALEKRVEGLETSEAKMQAVVDRLVILMNNLMDKLNEK